MRHQVEVGGEVEVVTVREIVVVVVAVVGMEAVEEVDRTFC